MPKFNPGMTIAQAKAWLRTRLTEGAECPVCTQHVRVYKRKLNSGMARSLIAMYRVAGTDWVHVPTQIGARSREEGKLAYWGLVEEERERRPDGGRAGYWRVTAAGERFLKDWVKVPKYAYVFDGRVLGMETNELVTIRDALGDKFDFEELMYG